MALTPGTGLSVARASTSGAAMSVLRRDLLLALRRPGEWLQPLAFFILVTVLFPLSVDPELSRLRQLAPAALWVTYFRLGKLMPEMIFILSGSVSCQVPAFWLFWPSARIWKPLRMVIGFSIFTFTE